jgi:type I restriction enzyme, R subunit
MLAREEIWFTVTGRRTARWTDKDRIHRLITEDTPHKVAADVAYQNAKLNSDRQNARIEHDNALGRVMMAVLKDDTELFKQFSDNESFRRWLTDTVFAMTYDTPASGPVRHPSSPSSL